MKPLLASVLCLLALTSAQAAEHTVKMISMGDTESMLFDPPVLHVAVGDTVHFKAEDRGHYSKSEVIPAGAQPWRTATDKDASVTLTVPGYYYYTCPPHLTMAMIGLIKVGDGGDKQPVEQALQTLQPKLVMNQTRPAAYLQQLK